MCAVGPTCVFQCLRRTNTRVSTGVDKGGRPHLLPRPNPRGHACAPSCTYPYTRNSIVSNVIGISFCLPPRAPVFCSNIATKCCSILFAAGRPTKGSSEVDKVPERLLSGDQIRNVIPCFTFWLEKRKFFEPETRKSSQR